MFRRQSSNSRTRVGIAAVADVAVAVAHGEALGALVDEEGGDQLLRAARGLFLARRHEDDGEAGDVGMADEMLGAVQHPVVAVLPRAGLHAAQVRPGAGFGHRQAIPGLAPDAGHQILLALFGIARQQDVRRPRHAGPVQGIVGPAQFLFVKQPGQRIEPRAAHLGRHVGGVKPGRHRLRLDLADQLHRQMAGALDHLLMRIKLVLDKGARRVDDHLLFFGQSEIHLIFPYGSTL